MQNVETITELSALQQGLLFHTLYAPNSGVYAPQTCCTFTGSFDVAAFKRAWEEMVARHAILRAAYHWEDLSKPLQVIHKQVELPWQEFDWRELTPDAQTSQFGALVQTDRHQDFQLEQAPLMRFTLVRLADDRYRFLWSRHHLVLDGWSTATVLRELLQSYAAITRGESTPLKRPRPYQDYIAWLQRQNLSAAETFWRAQLAGFNAPTPLTIERTGPVNQAEAAGDPDAQETYREIEAVLSAELSASLQQLARQHHLTVNTLFQGAWALLLSRYSGETDVVFGATVSGRPADLSEVEAMVGLFINTLPVRIQVSSQTPLLTWLQDLLADQGAREQYSYSSLTALHGWSDLPGDAPLFESLLAFENYPVDRSLQEKGQSDFQVEDVQTIEQTNYPLTVVVLPAAAITLKVLYNTHRFEEAAIRRVLDHLERLLEGMVATPTQPLGAFPLLTEREREALVDGWNQTATDYPRDQCIPQLFEAQVAQHPEAPAVVLPKDGTTEAQVLSYQTLNVRANQVAHYLRRLGMKPGDPVGLCLDRSAESVIGTLGILKAGGTYIPLDPTYPQERLSFIVADTGTTIIVTQQQWADHWVADGSRVICLDSDWGRIEAESDQNLVNQITPAYGAYVMYTSGSTGQPKGITIPHRAITRLVFKTNYIELDARERIAFASNSAFDAATFELWGALLHGGRLIRVSQEVALSPPNFADLLQTQGITSMFLTTALFNQLARHVPTTFSGMRTLMIGGEAVDPRWVSKVLAAEPPERLLHVYGPTESTTFATWHQVTEVEPDAMTIPIGGPLSNTQVYVLDPSLNPVPLDIPGELYLGGDGLAHGYLNQPQLTAERFVPNPFSQEAGSRMYKTGDLVRVVTTGDGSPVIEFLGRADNQIKLRGFRVELGEIEAVLSTHPLVAENVVILREGVEGDKRLLAYVVPRAVDAAEWGMLNGQGGADNSPSVILQDYLRKKLPSYMIPAAFITLDALPLNPNGKVDRRALPDPFQITQPDEEYTAPRTQTEEALAPIWTDVLGLDRVSIHDNFFDIGGHSLLATQVISRLRAAFQIELPIRAIFDHATIAEMAIAIEQTRLEQVRLAAQIPPTTDITADEEEGEI